MLLEGIKTGISKVSVRLASGLYSKVPAAEVNVMVVSNLYLVPGSTFIMVGAKVDYTAEQIKSNMVRKFLEFLFYYKILKLLVQTFRGLESGHMHISKHNITVQKSD